MFVRFGCRGSAVPRLVVLTISATILGACDFVERRLDGPYSLCAADTEETALCHDMGEDTFQHRVRAVVFAAGADPRHVIAKRHPPDDRSVTEYFIIDRARDGRLADSAAVTGPLTAAEFAAARRRMGVSPSLQFTLVQRHLE
jgi:hypothetical protein